VIVLNSGLRAVCTLVFVCLFSRAALAQSVLNFPARDARRIAITNTTPYAADVKFTLYNADGSPSSAPLNPVSRRVPPKGQTPFVTSEIFGILERQQAGTWIQASSAVSGLEGTYASVESNKSGSTGGEAFDPQTVQTIPYIPSDARTPASIQLTNPSSQAANFTVMFFNAAGGIVTSPFTNALPARAQMNVTTPPRATSARIRSDVGIIAVASNGGDFSMLVRGQGSKSQAQVLVAPYFRNRDGITSQLILTNSNNTDAEVTVTFFSEMGSQPIPPARLVLRANGTWWLTGPPDGWVMVEAPGSPLSGIVIVTSGSTRSAMPLQVAPADRMLFSGPAGKADFDPTLNLVGTRERDAAVTVTLSRRDGTTIAKRDLSVAPLSRYSAKLSDVIPHVDRSEGGYVTVRSTSPVYGLQLTNGDGGSVLSGMSPQNLAPGFQASPAAGVPRITAIEPLPTGPDGVKRITIVGENIDDNATLSIGGRIVPVTSTSTGGRFSADLPNLDPGYVNVKVRSGGFESTSFPLLVVPDDTPYFLRTGHALYEKVEVLESGLDPNRTVLEPIRGARVEVWDPATQQAVSVSETDEDGNFRIVVPDRLGLRVRVLSRSSDVRVLDNTSGNQIYALTESIGNPGDSTELELIESTRQAGAFNIIDNVHRGNALLAQTDFQAVPPLLTVYWSEKNTEAVLLRLTEGKFRSTFFDPRTNTAYILGDRNVDSDEFDDSVILHEYAHMLAAQFSRDDSPGGPHSIGELLDPRLAWSEGWANFFSCAARGSSVYLDSKSPGVPAVRYDLEEDTLVNGRGYASEGIVGGLLWDLLDENQDNSDSAQLPFATLWTAFTNLRNVRYMYLPYFLEALLATNPDFSDELRAMVIRRSVDFQPDGRPSVVNPFPTPIAVGELITGNVDSFSVKRQNLIFSNHFYSFTTPTAVSATITLAITGLGSGNNLNANDLDLFLTDANGRRLEVARRGGNGQPEIISGVRLSPGTYYIEVRSYYVNAETNTTVFNSGGYRLNLQLR
jgi:hypothetical protein